MGSVMMVNLDGEGTQGSEEYLSAHLDQCHAIVVLFSCAMLLNSMSQIRGKAPALCQSGKVAHIYHQALLDP